MDADASLPRRLRGGDEQAFADLVARYHSAMLRLALSFVPSQAVAEEVAQDTWLALNRVDAVKRSELLRAGIDRLPARQREVVLLRDVEGLTRRRLSA
ncbi:MAG TPA: sigma factor-like helix-turn-helix DNA-binding protein [Trebonia sp.]|nr:sigma factor-like helix-turn-helix DNA-binding protein [Trebonia sp.]